MVLHLVNVDMLILGMRSRTLAAIKVLKDYNVNLVKSHLIPALNEISKRAQIPVEQLKEEIRKPTGKFGTCSSHT